MKFNRDKFYQRYKKHFGALKDYQVEGLNDLLWGFETYWGWWQRIDHIANALAQVKLESAHSFLPVVEGYYLAKGVPQDKRYFQGDHKVVKNFQKTLRYYPYFGMGHIQLTWKNNFEKLDKLIRDYFPEIVSEFDAANEVNFSLAKNPRQTLDAKISFCVFTIGMQKGTFTGKELSDYNRAGGGFDHFNARAIVNGDKNYVKQGEKVGNKIVKYAAAFEDILRFSRIESDQTTEPPPVATEPPPVAIEPAEPEPDETGNILIGSNSGFGAGTTGDASGIPEPNLVSGELVAPEPIGDEPDAEPRWRIQVECWKNWCVARAKQVGKWFGMVNGVSIPALSGVGASLGGRWIYIALGIIAFIFIVSLIIAGIALLCVAVKFILNRLELKRYFSLVADSMRDPNSYNIGLDIEHKTLVKKGLFLVPESHVTTKH